MQYISWQLPYRHRAGAEADAPQVMRLLAATMRLCPVWRCRLPAAAVPVLFAPNRIRGHLDQRVSDPDHRKAHLSKFAHVLDNDHVLQLAR